MWRYVEICGDMGRYGEVWGDVWGDTGRYVGDMWRYGEMWGDTGRYGEICGDVWPPRQRGVAQVVRHHDGRVERREVERRDGLAVEALLGLDHGGALVLVALALLVRLEQSTPPENRRAGARTCRPRVCLRAWTGSRQPTVFALRYSCDMTLICWPRVSR